MIKSGTNLNTYIQPRMNDHCYDELSNLHFCIDNPEDLKRLKDNAWDSVFLEHRPIEIGDIVGEKGEHEPEVYITVDSQVAADMFNSMHDKQGYWFHRNTAWRDSNEWKKRSSQ